MGHLCGYAQRSPARPGCRPRDCCVGCRLSHRTVAFRRFRAADVRSILITGTGTPQPRPTGDALILDLLVALTRPLDAYKTAPPTARLPWIEVPPRDNNNANVGATCCTAIDSNACRRSRRRATRIEAGRDPCRAQSPADTASAWLQSSNTDRNKSRGSSATGSSNTNA